MLKPAQALQRKALVEQHWKAILYTHSTPHMAMLVVELSVWRLISSLNKFFGNPVLALTEERSAFLLKGRSSTWLQRAMVLRTFERHCVEVDARLRRLLS